MRTFAELTATDDPAIPLVRAWAAAATIPCELLPPSPTSAETLLAVQDPSQSVLGAVALETGGILLDHGWLRLLGSGHARLPRTLPAWNEGRADGYYLVADDAVGGFFALNGGRFGSDLGKVHYFAPDTLRWEAIGLGYSQFVCWAMSDRLSTFYASARWPSWKVDLAHLPGDRCFAFYPPLWTEEGSPEKSHRGDVPIAESWSLQMDFKTQLDGT